jgi:N-carbamoyl-L-amino-acid hydrolase
MNKPLEVNGSRLWDSLMQMAEIGATARGGCNRQALTDEDRIGRELFVGWCEAAGCSVRVDQMGNLFARRPGRKADAAAVMTGSHLDTQPTGGKFDGVYGVLAGLEVVRSLNDADVTTEHPIDVVVWTNEEGARFSPAMVGSGVWAGEFELEYGWNRTDKQGTTLRSALEATGYLGSERCEPFPVHAAFELHIEQGPILEAEGLQVGVVRGVQGMRWYDLTLTGQPVHAGPTPMEQRRDPFMALHPIMADLYALASQHSPWARVTFGDISASPGVRNTVPETVTIAVDLRHPDETVLETMEQDFRQIVARHASATGIEHAIRTEWQSPAVAFDEGCVRSIQQSVERLGYPHQQMFSGAGHDAVYVSRVAPTAMIFIPCEQGISHNEAENATPQDIKAGADVLLNAVLDQAVPSE